MLITNGELKRSYSLDFCFLPPIKFCWRKRRLPEIIDLEIERWISKTHSAMKNLILTTTLSDGKNLVIDIMPIVNYLDTVRHKQPNASAQEILNMVFMLYGVMAKSDQNLADIFLDMNIKLIDCIHIN